MKKILLATAIVFTLGLTASAQRGGRDGFFSYDDFDNMNRDPSLPAMPTSNIGEYNNDPAPLGTGLLIMTALGAGYAVARRKKQ